MENEQILLKPRTLNIKTPDSRTKSLIIGGNRRSISPIGNTVNFWSSLNGLRSKYPWMKNVFDGINEEIPNEKLSIDVIRCVELCLEKFADNYLSQVQVLGFDQNEFGNEILFSWFGFDVEEIENDNDMSDLRDNLQVCYDEEIDNITEDSSDVTGLFVKISKMLMINFLTASVNNMLINSVSTAEELTLFFVLYTAEHDARFSIFRLEEYLEKDIIPESPSKDGLSVGTLQLILADFIKTNYNVRPSVEPGSVELLAGLSNIIDITNPKCEELIFTKINKSIQPTNNINTTIFLNIHRYILYVVFEEIQRILQNKTSKQWTNSIVLDAVNTGVQKFRREME
jgi:hypothetical protein